MPTSKQFIEWVELDLLSKVPNLTIKRMFGGYGLYSQGEIFGITVDNQLYFKVGEGNRAEYEERGSTPFEYTRRDGKATSMSYWNVPDDILEKPELATEWAKKAILEKQKISQTKQTKNHSLRK